MSSKQGNLRFRKAEGIDKRNETENKNTGGKKGYKRKVSVPSQYATRYSTHRIWTRAIMIFSLMIVVYFFAKREKEVKFALQKEKIPIRFQKIICSPKYLTEMRRFAKCIPHSCGRFVTDNLIAPREAEILLNLAKDAHTLGGLPGGSATFNLHSGVFSKGDEYVNVYNVPEWAHVTNPDLVLTYKLLKAKIKKEISEQFQIDEDSLRLTHPTYFSRMDNFTAKEKNQEHYFDEHVDQDLFSSYHYTSIIYLSDYGKDFQGGRFVFVDGSEKNRTQVTIEPKKGRLSAFTSGPENVHYVERITSGTRFAITIAFTCNEKYEIRDPSLKVVGSDPNQLNQQRININNIV